MTLQPYELTTFSTAAKHLQLGEVLHTLERHFVRLSVFVLSRRQHNFMYYCKAKKKSNLQQYAP